MLGGWWNQEEGAGHRDWQAGSGKEEPQREVGCIRERKALGDRGGLQVSQGALVERERKPSREINIR